MYAPCFALNSEIIGRAKQGKLLPQPERVPFRLTADMIDGLGISGTQGVFQRCAEETLRVLRDGSETILTVLEVFKYDPLHSWYVSTSSVMRGRRSDLLTGLRASSSSSVLKKARRHSSRGRPSGSESELTWRAALQTRQRTVPFLQLPESWTRHSAWSTR